MKVSKKGYTLITGATSGIGNELARLFAQDGNDLIIVARTEEDLNSTAKEFTELYGVEVIPIVKDLFEENSAEELFEEISSRGISVEILVNDAGQGVYGLFLETDIEAQMRIIHLNIISLTKLTYFFVSEMKKRNSGKILQLGSVVSELPSPYQAVYGGTKAFVLSFSEALRNELKDTNITVTVLQPGATDTDFFHKAGAMDSKIVQDKSKLSNPADVAKVGYDALMKGTDKVVAGLKNKLQVSMSNITPDTKVAEKMKKETEPTEKKK